MTLLKQFNETGQEIGSEDIPLNDDNLSFYLQQYGKERADGYQAGMSDILKGVEVALTSKDKIRFPVPTHAMVRNAFESYSQEKERFLNTSLANQIKEHGSSWQKGYIDSVSDFIGQADLILFYRGRDGGEYYDRRHDGYVRRNVEQYFKEKTTLIKILQPTIKSFIPHPPA